MGITNLDSLQLDGYGAANNDALILGCGTASSPATTDVADSNFLEFRTESEATSGDARGFYNRLYISGAGGGGEAQRNFTTVNDVAASTVHGQHNSLNFGTSGTVTGQGIAGRNTLHIPATALTSNVTLSALQAEIWSDASTSDPGGSTLLSCIRLVNAGNANGMADVDDDAVAFDFQGFTVGDGNMIEGGAPGTLAASIKIRVGSTPYYLGLYSAASAT